MRKNEKAVSKLMDVNKSDISGIISNEVHVQLSHKVIPFTRTK